MIDAKAFGQELAGMVKAQFAPVLSRLDALEKKLAALPDVAGMIAEAIEAIPKPERGEPGEQGESGPAGTDGRDGRDGCDVKDLLRVEGGELVATFSDGRTKNLGPIVGKDGSPGADGKDGLGFDDMTAEYDGERTITLRFAKGEQVKEFSFHMPVVLDRGVFKEGSEYKAGDAVTWGGCLWIAQEDTADKPDSGKAWRLSVKRGRDGKDGIVRAVNEKPVVRVG